ncbi:MAG: M48 family metallopeptidase [Telluria sp.]
MIPANYFDGRSARLHPVDMALDAGTITLAGPGIARTMPVTSVRLAEPFAGAPLVLDFDDGARCEVEGTEAKAALAAALGYRKSRVVRWQEHWYGALAALVVLVALVLGAVRWGIPLAGDWAVASMPASVDRKVGDAAFAALDGKLFGPSRLDEGTIREVHTIFNAIAPRRTRMPLTLRVMDGGQQPPNALVLPNGAIIINDAMVAHIRGKDPAFSEAEAAQLAGVLAHEIGHVEGRHSMHALARASLSAALAGALFGDFSAVVAGAPALVLNMSYSRDMETRADDYAVGRLAAEGMAPDALANLFDSLEAAAPGQADLPSWLRTAGNFMSSHPMTAERTAHIRARSRDESP